MATWIVFLRAVNVGKRSYPMAELRHALTDAGYTDVEDVSSTGPSSGGHYVSLLKASPTAAATRTIEDDPPDWERLVVSGRFVHLVYDKPDHEAKRSNASVEKAIGVATNRNAKVIRALALTWGSAAVEDGSRCHPSRLQSSGGVERGPSKLGR